MGRTRPVIFNEPVATFLADDTTLEHALPFLAALRRTNPDMRVAAIARSPAVRLLGRFTGLYRFEILRCDFAALDVLERICAARPTGMLRALAIFDIAAPAIIHVDTHACVGPLAEAVALLAAAPTPIIAVASPDGGHGHPPAMVGLGGPRVGSAAVIAAVRERLVACLTRVVDGALLAPLLQVASAPAGLRETAFDLAGPELAWRADPRDHPARIAALEDVTDELTIADSGGSYVRRPALVIGAPPDLARHHGSEARRIRVEPPPAIVGRLRNATVRGRGIVMSEDGRVVRQSLINMDPGRLPELDRRAVVHRDAEAPVILLKQTWDDNYGHWLIESLPRVGLAAEFCDLGGCRFLVGDDGDGIGQVYRDSLGLLGIEPSRIIASSDATRFCAELIYAAPLTVQPWVKAPRVIDFLQRLAALVPTADPGPHKLYVSRNSSARRRLRNEAAIVACLAPRGYVTVEPQTLSFAAQVALFRGATHVVGNLGAALANLAFSPEGVRLLALTTEFMQDDFFWDLVSQRGGHYVSLHGKALDPSAGMQSDFEVDPARLLSLLKDFEGEGAWQP